MQSDTLAPQFPKTGDAAKLVKYPEGRLGLGLGVCMSTGGRPQKRS